jgi:hypothetical protein
VVTIELCGVMWSHYGVLVIVELYGVIQSHHIVLWSYIELYMVTELW